LRASIRQPGYPHVVLIVHDNSYLETHVIFPDIGSFLSTEIFVF
jgi:hypothetical protein